MNILRDLAFKVRLHSLRNDLLSFLPVWLAAGLFAALYGLKAALCVLFAGLLLGLGVALWRMRRLDQTWLIRQLNLKGRDMEDSADLLFTPESALRPLQRLQKSRLIERLSPAIDLKPEWRWKPVSVSAVGALLIVMVGGVLWWSQHRSGSLPPPVPIASSGPARLLSAEIQVTPPAYTHQAAHREMALDIKTQQASRLVWRLRFTSDIRAVRLVFHDGQSLSLRHEGEVWTAPLTLERSRLYRIVADGLPPQSLHRLEAVSDTAPKVQPVTPDRALSLVTPGQAHWPLVFTASDDYGLSSMATLRIIQAQGEGENITFRERTLTLSGAGSATDKRFSTRLDLKALGFTRGDDLIVQLTVTDNRAPSPQETRSPSLILRWPSDLGSETGGLELLARQTLPAYFRSQRQIIIDAEALLKEKSRLKADTFLNRSDAIGVDQRLLRLRYGQFLGEEAEGGREAPPGLEEGHSADDGHDHGGETSSEPAVPAFGAAGDVLSQYGHTHDEAEAATLLDPETRATLKKALDEMWQSELHLRQGDPKTALPHAYKALDYIKQVQQATRIFLSRVGPELPPIDENRRMTGKREGIAGAPLKVTTAPSPDAPVVAAWTALAPRPGAPADLPLAPLETWVRANEGRLSDPLTLLAAIDAVRADPTCAQCRDTLRARLWAVLSRPPAGVTRRAPADAAGGRYLDALERRP